MAIKNIGTFLSMSEIDAEFNRGKNLNSYRGTNRWDTISQTNGTFSSGTIKYSDFYGKALVQPGISAEILIVGGGGGGGAGTYDSVGGGGGGGGGGEFKSISRTLLTGQTISVTIGAGGAGGIVSSTTVYAGLDKYGNPTYETVLNVSLGVAGSSTVVDFGGVNETAVGGQPGKQRFLIVAGAWYEQGQTYAGGAGGNGNPGGGYGTVGGSDGIRAAGGGGGIDDQWTGGIGGAGPLWLNNIRYSGGGTGGADYTNLTAGGAGGGGSGGSSMAGTSGGANTGGGGGGGGSSSGATSGGSGGSGIVIIRYLGSAALFAGGSISSLGGYIYHRFNSNTTFTI